jgi:hypothetical protein
MRALSSRLTFFALTALFGLVGCAVRLPSPAPQPELAPKATQFDGLCLGAAYPQHPIYPAGYQSVPPILMLDVQEPLALEFDALITENGEPENYEVDIVSCDADWLPNGRMALEYYNGFLPDRIEPGQPSIGTYLPYYHYSYQVPAAGYAFKASGNYLLKVNHRGYPDSLLMQMRLLVVENTAVVNASVAQATRVSDRARRQRVDFSALLPVSGAAMDPLQDVWAVVLRNFCWQNAIMDLRPRFLSGQTLEFIVSPGDEFEGGSEYRLANLVNYPRPAYDSASGLPMLPFVALKPDKPNLPSKPAMGFDQNGGFAFLGPNHQVVPLHGEYLLTRFSLQAPPTQASLKVYVTGAFCGWNLLPENELSYDPRTMQFGGELLLKQGMYDYCYAVAQPDGSADFFRVEGSFGQTENTYSILLYFKAPGDIGARIIGMRQINYR